MASIFAQVAAEERPKLVKGIAALESTLAGDVLNVPFRNVPGGPMPMLGKNNRQALEPVLEWMKTLEVAPRQPPPRHPIRIPTPNRPL